MPHQRARRGRAFRARRSRACIVNHLSRTSGSSRIARRRRRERLLARCSRRSWQGRSAPRAGPSCWSAVIELRAGQRLAGAAGRPRREDRAPRCAGPAGRRWPRRGCRAASDASVRRSDLRGARRVARPIAAAQLGARAVDRVGIDVRRDLLRDVGLAGQATGRARRRRDRRMASVTRKPPSDGGRAVDVGGVDVRRRSPAPTSRRMRDGLRRLPAVERIGVVPQQRSSSLVREIERRAFTGAEKPRSSDGTGRDATFGEGQAVARLVEHEDAARRRARSQSRRERRCRPARRGRARPGCTIGSLSGWPGVGGVSCARSSR